MTLSNHNSVSPTPELAGVELRRELELAGGVLCTAQAELLRRLRESHIGDDWMWES